MNSTRIFHRLLLALVILTLLSLYAQAHWMQRVWRFDQNPKLNFSAIDDRPEGGNSVAIVKRNADGISMDCEIKVGYAWPFCELAIELAPEQTGIDLGQFDTLNLQLEAEGLGKPQALRIFLRNFNPAYSKSNLSPTLKPHEIVFTPHDAGPLARIRLTQFMVASWWMQEHPSSIAHLGPELEHVTTMSIATAGNMPIGSHHIVFKRGEFVGQWISDANFRLIIIFIWIAAILLYLAWAWYRSNFDLHQTDKLRLALKANNEILETRVEERTRALAASNARLIETLQNLEGARHELVQSEKNAALGSLVSGVAHELNTPIGNAVLVGSTLQESIEQLQASLGASLTKKSLTDYIDKTHLGTQILNQNLKRAANLITNFKQLSADQQSEQKRVFLLSDIVEETRLAMHPKLRQTAHQLKIQLDDTISLDSYPGPISQVIINLINNALLHAFDGIEQGHMLLESFAIDEDSIAIHFSDDGLGIPASTLHRIFEPFFTTKLGKGGSGLGMHLVYNIVTQQLGGKILVLSGKTTRGTRIEIQIPRVAPTQTQTAIKIGVPADVIDDYRHFVKGRNLDEIAHFDEPSCRRDVFEFALFLRTLQQHFPSAQMELIIIDSYAQGLDLLEKKVITALGTTVWKQDLSAKEGSYLISPAIIKEGQYAVGIYGVKHDKSKQSLETVEDLRQLKFVSNSDWCSDWSVLRALGIDQLRDVKTWQQMVYLVYSGEAQALLSTFTSHRDLAIQFETCQLSPLVQKRILLGGSRHYVFAQNELAQQISAVLFPAFAELLAQGLIETALHECGFLNAQTANWPTLRP